ncbi:phosphopantetheine-binding protein [Acinetobacter shaoyimingii]|uniref:Carrier domain-containing protein n=1 Tax=Acinetobacter shaoyimingii TaxID=2715164 RepID=A0A6G8RWB3_9GAMM|nr:phosphopantetheine-binding protein [Acinetobacter shaoyimingii]QIO06130.1 hypothetical protein G8E00_09260 [Acinetobacter shaoyimingii]
MKDLTEQQYLLSKDSIIQLVSAELEIPAEDIQMDDDLLLLGLDSVRLMTLVGIWQEQGSNVSFEGLAEEPNLQAWIEKILN